MLPLVKIEPGPLINLSDSKCNTLLSELTGSSCGHALLILTYTSKFSKKNQVVHEQKFKDPLSSTCQINPERKVLD